MTSMLDIVHGDPAPVKVLFQDDGEILDIGTLTIDLRVGTDPVLVLPVSKFDASNGIGHFDLSSVPLGIWDANFKIDNYTTLLFSINCSSGI